MKRTLYEIYTYLTDLQREGYRSFKLEEAIKKLEYLMETVD